MCPGAPPADRPLLAPLVDVLFFSTTAESGHLEAPVRVDDVLGRMYTADESVSSAGRGRIVQGRCVLKGLAMAGLTRPRVYFFRAGAVRSS